MLKRNVKIVTTERKKIMLTVINGYKTVKSVSPTVFAGILKEIRDCVLKAQEKQYNLLFGEEINRLADMYVLDYTSIPEGVSVWDECVNRLNIRIDNDSRSNQDPNHRTHESTSSSNSARYSGLPLILPAFRAFDNGKNKPGKQKKHRK